MINKEEFISTDAVDVTSQSINYREVINKYLYHWPVFALAMILCLTSAFLYLRFAEKVYYVNGTLLIKDNQKSGVSSPGGEMFNELDLFGSSKVVDNEIEILKSKTLMRKVVDRLNLSVSIKANGRVVARDLYAKKPVKVTVVKMDSLMYGKTLELTFPSNNTFMLNDHESGQTVTGVIGALQRNKFGIFKIELGQAVKSLPPGLSFEVHDPQFVVNYCLSRLSVGLASKQSTVLNLGFETTVPDRGKDIINTLVNVYNEAALVDKNQTTQSTIKFIDERLKLISGELTDVEKNVETFKSTRGLTDLSSDANLFLENVKTNDFKLNEINLQISVIDDIKRYIRSESSEEKFPNTLGINDPVLLGQISQLAELQLRRDQLLGTTTIDNPMVQPLLKQIETTRASIRSSIDNISKSLEVSKAELKSNDNQFQGSIRKIPGQERQLISIKRQQSIKESLYLYLLQKKEEAALSFASTVSGSRTVDPAFSSGSPIKPKGQLIYFGALVLGILLPIGYLYGKEMLNVRIESSADISKLSALPILGEILMNEDGSSIVVDSSSRKAIAEQFRFIRTNLQFLAKNQELGKGNVILLTSSMSGEGKSFVANNLSATFAVSGKKTVLLEMDLRKPKVSKYLSLSNKIGLSNYLIGQAKIEEIISPSKVHPNFFVIGSGPVPPNPSELLIKPEIDVLIEYLKGEFDQIIIDTPPIGLVTDAQILARYAELSLYLVRQNVTYKEQVRKLDQLYKTKKFPSLNVIFNGVKPTGTNSYGYGYYSDDFTDTSYSFKKVLQDIAKRF